MTKAKEFFKGRTLLRMEDSRSVAAWIGGQEILTGNVLSVDEVIEIVDTTTSEDIRETAGEIFLGDQLHLAVIGPIRPDEPLEELLKI